ncbi:DUF4148 domain-containing protein [Burkholderia guangdongensis]|uniref:DUF4148 domain-containing protein n=1 Tax=Burkholderia guangdongensis TaxID=1792500 RepID=UPI0015CC0CC4|nr:DUF4148 domain-containing protein [Burkholderia guangdongensis]
MKSLVQTLAVALALSVPIVTYAQQTNQPVTRAQVRAELKQLEQAGYNPRDWFYPESLQAAEAKISNQHAMPQTDQTGYGHDGGAATESGK